MLVEKRVDLINERITSENVYNLAKFIALSATKSYIKYVETPVIKMYDALRIDIAQINNVDHVLSSSFDFVQAAALFLCENMGRVLSDTYKLNNHGRKITILDMATRMVNVLLAEKAELEKSLENLVRAIEKGVVTETTTKRITDTEFKIKDCEKKILIEQSKVTTTITKEEVQSYLKEALQKESNSLLELLIKEIILYDDKVIIYYNYTKQNPTKSPDDSQGFCFYMEEKTLEQPNTSSLLPKIHTILVEMRIR